MKWTGHKKNQQLLNQNYTHIESLFISGENENVRMWRTQHNKYEENTPKKNIIKGTEEERESETENTTHLHTDLDLILTYYGQMK